MMISWAPVSVPYVQLNQQGVTRFVLATGYLESIRDFFGDGSVGLEHLIQRGAVEWDTGRRLWEARELLPEAFVLLYGDNFTLFDLPRSQEVFTDEVDLTLLVTEKERGEYKTTGNVMMRDDGVVLDYNKTPYQKGYDHVEIGYMLTRKTVMLNALDDKDCNLSSVLMTLCREGTANAVISPNPYFWITDPDSWKRAEDYLATLDIFQRTFIVKKARHDYHPHPFRISFVGGGTVTQFFSARVWSGVKYQHQ